MKILLLSFTDSTNFGDQMIVERLIDRLKKYGEVITYSYNLKKNHVFEERVEYTGKKRSKVKEIFDDKLRKNIIVDKILAKRILRITRKKILESSFESDIINSDLLVIGGGNTIFDLTKNSCSAKKFELFIDIAKKHNKKIYLMDVGIGPFVTSKQVLETREVVKKIDYVSVRDTASFEFLQGMDNVYLGIDPVFSLPKKIIGNEESIRSEESIIGICIMDYSLNKISKVQYENYISDMKKLVNSIIKYRTDVQLILFNSEIRDFESVKEVYNGINHERVKISFIGSKLDLLNEYNKMDLIIGTRMHSMIIAKSQEIPIIGISWQPKVSEIFKMFDDEDSVFDITLFGNQIDSIIKKIECKLKEDTEVKQKIDLKMIKMREQIDIDNLEEIMYGKI